MGKRRGRHIDKALSPVAVRKLGPGRHYDGGGLFLEVEESGSRRWLLRTMVHGKRREFGLGSFSTVTLADAREKAATLRRIARNGGDPAAEKRKASVPTFESASRDCYELRAKSWHNEKHRAQWLSTLTTYAFPKIGRMRVNRVGTSEALTVLQPIWLSKPETARRLRQRIGTVLDWAKAKGFRDTVSPTDELGGVLPKQTDTPQHHAAMPYVEIPAFLKQLRQTTATDATKAALEFVILTASRTTETLQAKWPEVDFKTATWVIPKERTKGKRRPHSVPLPPRAVAILQAMKAAHSGQGDFIFEARAGKPFSQMALLMLMRRLETGATVHGFRSSFRDWASERTSFPREVSEAALAHAVEGGATEAAYRRSELLEKRRKLMTLWAAHCAGGVSEVLHLKRAS